MISWQEILNYLYRYPKSHLRTYRRFGGWMEFQQMQFGRRKMQEASRRLSPMLSVADGRPVYFLTGEKYLYQTLFCIRSLIRSTASPLRFILVDDGSFNPQLEAEIRQLLPGAAIISREQVEANLDRALPESKFPAIREKRLVYPHLKKLTDIHTVAEGDWKLVLDSDMLFWHEPAELLRWLSGPDIPLFLTDCSENYGYPRTLMERLSGSGIPVSLNVGIIGLESCAIPWKKLEGWIEGLENEAGPSYYLEQALTAMIIGSSPALQLPAEKYVVQPSGKGTGPVADILHHYVDLSKRDYFRKMWKLIV